MEEESRLETIALVGNPNAGKTTLYNALTGSRQKVGNYAGVTVEKRSGETFLPNGKKIRVLDLPGCYSLRANSPDEKIARDVLMGEAQGEARPDLVVCVVDASAMERHLNLVLQVIELGVPVVIALNMVDVAEKHGLRLDPQLLSEELNVPVVPMQANTGKGLIELKQALRHPFPPVAPAPWKADADEATEQARLETIKRVCNVAVRRPDSDALTTSDKIDGVVLHPVLGWIVFLGTMFLVFLTIFSLAEIPKGWIESGFGLLSEWVNGAMKEGDLRDLLTGGVIAGVSGVVVFLPQILLLFFFIGLLESSGYMARAAYLMDGIMSKVGLSGKSFLPLLSSYACAIPGVMATRTIDSAKERLTTIFIAPWMSCSARLPVYFLLIPMLLSSGHSSWKQAAVMFGIYFGGTVTAFLVAKLLRKKLGPDEVKHHFMLELPPYRSPQWGYIFRHVGDRGWAFVRKAGTVILGLSILLWALQTYPKTDSEDEGEKLEHSAMGRIAGVIEPVVKPLGFDGRIGTAVLTSFAAREVFNTSMGVIFHAEGEDGTDEFDSSLRGKLEAATWPNGSPLFTPLTIASLIAFYVFALQCLPTSAVVAREAGSWRWAVGQFVFMMLFAYMASFVIYQGGKLLGFI